MAETLTQHSAGGIVYRRQGRTIEVVMIKDTYGRWTFPKGHTEPNETLEETAAREIAEETGLDAQVLQLRAELGEMDYWFTSTYASDLAASKQAKPNKDGSVMIHKYVTYYLFELVGDGELKPQAGEVDAIEWLPLSEMAERNEYEDNKDLITKAERYLNALV